MISFKLSTRLVIILKNIVIKIPLSKRGYLQGLNEKKIWDKYKDTAPLAELKGVCGGVVCQRRYALLPLRESLPNKEVTNIKSLIPEFNFNNCDLYNYKNWGIFNKKYILLDYGIDKYIASLY
tara:strand:- start:342 stop:710 length:369 start_codon:yes stop_codon:yes gene_type:complete